MQEQLVGPVPAVHHGSPSEVCSNLGLSNVIFSMCRILALSIATCYYNQWLHLILHGANCHKELEFPVYLGKVAEVLFISISFNLLICFHNFLTGVTDIDVQ